MLQLCLEHRLCCPLGLHPPAGTRAYCADGDYSKFPADTPVHNGTYAQGFFMRT